MNNFAVVKASGKQYKVIPGLILDIDKIEGDSGSSITFSEVLLFGDKNATTIGTPNIKGAEVTATIIEQIKGDKLRIGKFKAKSKYRRVTGFRSQLTKIEISRIKGGKE